MSAMIRLLLVALALAAAAGLAPAAHADDPSGVSVDARVDTDTITVGDRIRLTLVARAVEGLTLEQPAAPAALGAFEVLDQRVGSVQRTPDGGSLLRVELSVTAFRTGALVLPGFRITYTTPDGRRGEALSADLPIGVRSILGNDPNPQLLDMKPPLTIPGQATSYTQLAAAVAMVAAALGITMLMLRRQRKWERPLLVVAASGFDPMVAAALRLDDIEAANYLERGDVVTYFGAISHCLRNYLEQQYGIPALSLTSEELRSALERVGVDRWQSRMLVVLLEESDAVRWAGYRPATARALRAIIQAREILATVQPQPAGALR